MNVVGKKNQNTLFSNSIVVCALLFIINLGSKNPLELFFSLFLIPFFIYLFFHKKHQPFLFVVALFEWITATIKVFDAEFKNLNFNDVSLHRFPNHIQESFWLYVIHVSLFFLTVFFVTRSVPALTSRLIISHIKNYNPLSAILAYLIFAFVVNPILSYILFPLGLGQLFYQLYNIKWALMFIALFVVVIRKKHIVLFFAIVLIEFILSFAAFFAEFKNYFVYLIIIMLFFSTKLNIKQYLLLSFIAILAFNFAVLWTIVKGEQRKFLSGGARSQAVVVSTGDALSNIGNLVINLNSDQYAIGLESLVARISYIDFLSACIEYIPAQRPHEQGLVWWSAISHVFTPRVFFPDKAIIEDSEHLMKYTGLVVASTKEGTSLSLGAIGDSYVDFGTYFMWFPIVLYGIFIGLMYRYIVYNSPNALFGYAFTFPMLNFFTITGSASIKLFGWAVVYWMGFYLLNKFVIKYLNIFMQEKN